MKEIIKLKEENKNEFSLVITHNLNIAAPLGIAIYGIKRRALLFFICYAIWFRDILILPFFRNK